MDSNRRAEELLLRACTPKQARRWKRGGLLPVIAGKGLAARRFWISTDPNKLFRVQSYFFQYCVIPLGSLNLPRADRVLTLKLYLENDPDYLFKRAVWQGLRPWVENTIIAFISIVIFSGLVGLLIGAGYIVMAAYDRF